MLKTNELLFCETYLQNNNTSSYSFWISMSVRSTSVMVYQISHISDVTHTAASFQCYFVAIVQVFFIAFK